MRVEMTTLDLEGKTQIIQIIQMTVCDRKYSPGAVAEWKVEDLHFEARKQIEKSAGSAIG